MDRIPMYRYLGTNGTITSPVHLEDIYYVRMVKLLAGPETYVTNGTITEKSVVVPEEEENQWYEVPVRA